MKKNKMIDNDLKSLRKQENDEILKHLEAISKIINVKYKRCKSILGCLGCVFSQGEVGGDISHAYKLTQVEVASYQKKIVKNIFSGTQTKLNLFRLSFVMFTK